MTKAKRQKVYQIKISLIGAKPPIWRRVLTPASMTLGEFHLVIQEVMGWLNGHLHDFYANGVRYGMTEDDDGFGFALDDVRDENRCRLSQVLKRTGDSLEYQYDFGDNWRHKITLEKIQMLDDTAKIPVCIKGRRACPKEDIGGIWGYAAYLEAINNPSHPDHDDMLEWHGKFDPEAFDITEANNSLASYFG